MRLFRSRDRWAELHNNLAHWLAQHLRQYHLHHTYRWQLTLSYCGIQYNTRQCDAPQPYNDEPTRTAIRTKVLSYADEYYTNVRQTNYCVERQNKSANSRNWNAVNTQQAVLNKSTSINTTRQEVSRDSAINTQVNLSRTISATWQCKWSYWGFLWLQR